MANLDDWLTVHRSITLVDLQLDAQKILIYLRIIHVLKSCTCFEHCPVHLQEVHVVIVHMQPLVSSLSADDCLVHRLRMKFFLNRCTGQSPAENYPAHLQEVYVVIVYIQLLVSSLSAGDCLVHRLRKKFFLNWCTGPSPAEIDDTRGCIYTITTWTSYL